MENTIAVILAAGEGKRMKSEHSKVVHKVLGKSIIRRVYNAVKAAGIEECVIVVGHRQDEVREEMQDLVSYAVQEEQLGTGHAVMQAVDFIEKSKRVVILSGDAPLISGETIKNAVLQCERNQEYATIFTAEFEDPNGYGRIVRDAKGAVCGIVEHKDATEEQRRIKEINSSMYCFDSKALCDALKKITNNNVQGEYYLTDVIEIMIQSGLSVGTYRLKNHYEIMGINDRVQLAEANQMARKLCNEKHMRNGVTLIDPETTYIEEDVVIGRDSIVYPGNILEGTTVIGEECVLNQNNRITNSTLADHVEITSSVMTDSTVDSYTHVGPFAYIRPNTHIGKQARIGDFVELKNSTIGDKTKVSHLTYVGDSDVGSEVNFGCGTVTVNYDGIHKNRTTIGDKSFIGCNTNLIAPVKLGTGAYTAAGTTITKDVPENALAIGRCRQEIKEGWAKGKTKVNP
ncbi:MAG: bifunctional UDP-N-acetylglucosamine diphosphorylase/glucosamine-1-phosphate N-acetyltransferase GlmU [Clostridia bacterium]|nr:bifunctional UDP-N-acetylglucosamine diphosphorylase/glucosamine-1-phosphate N-acetyltransferase GlmU [Clostridia bacterium]